MRNLDDLVKYIYKRYTFPKSWWSKAHSAKRAIQLHTSEQVIIRCLESPFKDPKDIIFDYMMTLESCKKNETNKYALKILNGELDTLETLYNYFN